MTISATPSRLTRIFATLCVMLLQGCATALLATAPTTSTTMHETIVDQDVIRTIGFPTRNGERVDGLVLIGDKFSYFLKEGSEKIELMAQKLDPERINMANSITLALNETNFSGRLDFVYKSEKGEFTLTEQEILPKLCRRAAVPDGVLGLEKRLYYRCWVYVAGSIHSRDGLLAENISSLNKGRIVRFATYKSETGVSSKRILDKLFALPVTVAFDVITLPIQLIILGSQNNRKHAQPIAPGDAQ